MSGWVGGLGFDDFCLGNADGMREIGSGFLEALVLGSGILRVSSSEMLSISTAAKGRNLW